MPADSRRVVLIDFSDPQELGRWSSINDEVMGGRSQSRMQLDAAQHAVFSGAVSFENNGGFASVRRQPGAIGIDGVQAFWLEVCGDGRRYKLNLRTDDAFDGVNYQCAFQPPAGQWISLQLSCDQFAPTWRGRFVPDHPALNPAKLRQIGFLIGDRQEGAFSLGIRYLAVKCAPDLKDAP